MLGASFDPPADNKTFADAQAFGFRLLSDVDKSVGTAYEAARSSDEDYADMPRRVAYLIDPDGTIRKAYGVKDTAGFADQVLTDLDEIRGS